MTTEYAPGTIYRLPDGWTWIDVIQQREKWDIAPNFVPLACAPGVVAWGTATIGGYVAA